MKQLTLLIVFIGSSAMAFAQTLLSVNDQDISVDQFRRMYEKSAGEPDYSQQSVDKYADLFVTYHLKLAEAKKEGLDKNPEVLREIAVYEEKLVQDEMDKQMLNELMDEAKTRLKEEICASHILIPLKRSPSPVDTSLAYEDAIEIRKAIINGQSFDQLAAKHSADVSTKFSGGDLGCFTTLQLSSYQLENEIFKLEKGELSMPIRSRLGYHIIKINDRRPTHGLVRATQLFARANNTQDEEKNAKAKQAIDKAYRLLQSGEDFDVAADSLLAYEDELAVSKDEIDWFQVGTYNAAFENAIYALDEKGDYSKPVKTSLGWHIFRFDDQKPLPDGPEADSQLRDAIKEDERYFQSKIRFGDELKSTYAFDKKQDNIDLFVKQVAPGIGIEGWQIPSMYDLDKPFFTIGDNEFTARDFVNYVKQEHELEHFHTFDYYYDNFESNHLLDFHKENLIEENADLKALLQEFRNGIILFHLMEKELWANNDKNDQAVKNYFEEHKEEYRYPNKLQLVEYSVDADDNRANRRLARGFRKDKVEKMVRRINRKEEGAVTKKEKTISIDEATINGVDLSKVGQHAVQTENGTTKYLKSTAVIPGETKPFDEVKSKVYMDYQKHKENMWMQRLKENHTVTLHEDVLEQLYR